MSHTAAEKLFEAKREVGYRKRVYARLVAEGKMTKHNADRGISIMEEIAADYAAIIEAETAKMRLI